MSYTVYVDDNFHYMDEGERYKLGDFPTAHAAIRAAERVVDDYLTSAHKPGMTADELLVSYLHFGEDPYIIPADAGVHFSARAYARARCRALCGG